jgi:hypothetical protein
MQEDASREKNRLVKPISDHTFCVFLIGTSISKDAHIFKTTGYNIVN